MPQKLLQKYRIIEKLRSIDGSVQVFRARQHGLDRDVELRIMSRPGNEDTRGFRNFRAQFRILAGFDHPNISRVLDVGYTERRIYYTTEFRRAVSLEELLHRLAGPMSTEEVVVIADEICDALVHIHESGLSHRNVSTRTVYYDLDNNRSYISEFSLLKELESSGSFSFSSGPPSPSSFMMTPEFYDNMPYDKLTDLYMLGALLYRLLTFSYPLPTIEQASEMDEEAIFRVEAPSLRNNSIPQWMDRAILKLLAPLPADRYSDAGQFLALVRRKKHSQNLRSLILNKRKGLLEDLMTPKVERDAKSASGDDGGADHDRPGSDGDSGAGENTASCTTIAFDWNKDLVIPFALLVLLLAVLVPPALLVFSRPAPSSAQAGRHGTCNGPVSITDSPVTEKNFLARWSLFQKYLLSLSPEARDKRFSLKSLMLLKRLFYQDPEQACAKLEEATKSVIPGK